MKPATLEENMQMTILKLPGVRRLRDCVRSAPNYIHPKWKWVVRRFFDRWFLIPFIIRHKNGARFILCNDRFADQILTDLHDLYAPLFFPEDLVEVPAGEYILDLGAHHGTYAVTALSRFAKARIICVEPDPIAVACLHEHLKLNELLGRAEVHDCGVGSVEGGALLEQSADGSWGNRVVSNPVPTGVVSVHLQRLSSILNGRQPFLVKCNCEGGEFHAIPQLFDLGLRPQFIILLVHAEEGDSDALIQSVRDAGYSLTPVHSSASQPRYVCRLENTDARFNIADGEALKKTEGEGNLQ